MPLDTAKKPVEPVIFNSPRATIYLSGYGHPFPPGSDVPLHPEHAEAFKAMDLHKPLSGTETADEVVKAPLLVADKASDKPDGKSSKV